VVRLIRTIYTLTMSTFDATVFGLSSFIAHLSFFRYCKRAEARSPRLTKVYKKANGIDLLKLIGMRYASYEDSNE
jgi:hypothetical protein